MKRLKRLMDEYNEAAAMHPDPQSVAVLVAACELGREIARLRREIKEQAGEVRNFLAFVETHLSGQ